MSKEVKGGFVVALFAKRGDKVPSRFLKKSAGSEYYHWSGPRISSDITDDISKAGRWATEKAAKQAFQGRDYNQQSQSFKLIAVMSPSDVSRFEHREEIKAMESQIEVERRNIRYSQESIRESRKSLAKLKAKLRGMRQRPA